MYESVRGVYDPVGATYRFFYGVYGVVCGVFRIVHGIFRIFLLIPKKSRKTKPAKILVFVNFAFFVYFRNLKKSESLRIVPL